MNGGFVNSEMVDGYRDGINSDSPEPSGNRSNSYRHGFANGRDDLKQAPRDSAENIRRFGIKAVQEDLRCMVESGRNEN